MKTLLVKKRCARIRIALLVVVFIALPSLAVFAPTAHAQEFNLLNGAGKEIGHASYTIDTGKKEYKVHARFRYQTGGGSGEGVSIDELDSDQGNKTTGMEFTWTYKVTLEGDMTEGTLTNGPTQTTLTIEASKARDSVSVTKIQGLAPGNPIVLPMPKPDFLVAPNEDPSAIQMLLTTATAHPHADNTYLLLIPPTGPRAGAKSIYVSLQAPVDASGTLDGKPVALKHYVLKFYQGQAEIYTDATGALMEADMTPIHCKYVRTKFALAVASK